MSDAHKAGADNAEPDNADQQPALLGRIRPMARVVFGVLVIGTIFSLVAAGLDVALEIWRRAGGR
jgi:hypothetical protein